MRLLFVASDPMEFQGILANATDRQPARVTVDWARRARIGGNDVLLVANGVGAARAAAAVNAAVNETAAEFQPEAVVSTGFCGALDPRLGIADIVIGTAVVAGSGRFPLRPVSSGAPHLPGVICSIGRVAQTAAEKAVLRASGGAAVEMEAAGVAASAAEFGLPLYCIRAVTDLSDEDMANDFNEALRPDGHFDTMLILRSALRHPWVGLRVRVPELMRLRRRCIRAGRALGAFIADCRF